MGMTEQEAIEELKNYKACSGTQLPEEMEVAIKALEKQIPKKPKKEDEHSFFSFLHCPVCNGIVGIQQKHCAECGQKIDSESIRGNEDAE